MEMTAVLYSPLQNASPFASPIGNSIEGGATSKNVLSQSTCWEGILATDTLFLYSFHDSLSAYSWETIVNEHYFDEPLCTRYISAVNGFQLHP